MVAPGDKDFEGRLDIIRIRLEGNTLRIVHEVNSEVESVTGNHTTATVTVAAGLLCWVKRPIANFS